MSDLAHALEFPVAPALLSTLTQGKPVGLPNTVVISFSTLKQGSPWPALAPAMTDAHRAALCPQLSAMLVLHCLVDDQDHDWNDGNALFEINPDGTAAAAFHDYANSWTHAWTPPAPAPVRDWKRRNGPWQLTEKSQIIRAVERIGELAVNDLMAIINRIRMIALRRTLGNISLLPSINGARNWRPC